MDCTSNAFICAQSMEDAESKLRVRAVEGDDQEGNQAALVRGLGLRAVYAIHRFIEVSIGIGVALMLSLLWPEREVGTG
jgi:hypothetical protein